jgi:hypothetical protein
MIEIAVDNGPATFTVVDYPSDPLEVTVWLLDLESGPLSWAGATIVATAGGVAMTVNSGTAGRLVLSLTAGQVASLGAGAHEWIIAVTPSGGNRQTYVHGSIVLRTAGAALASTGVEYATVNNVAVIVIGG